MPLRGALMRVPLRKVRRTKRPALARKYRTANKFALGASGGVGATLVGAQCLRAARLVATTIRKLRRASPASRESRPLPPPPPPPLPPRALILRPEKTRAIVNYFA